MGYEVEAAYKVMDVEEFEGKSKDLPQRHRVTEKGVK
jgi:hypothetical protein